MKYRLGEICDVVSGGTPSRATAEFWDGGTIPWIKIGNIQRKYVDEADEYITQAGLEGSSAKMLSAGTILFTIFATLGEVGILTIEACTNQAIAGITIKNQSDILTDYLYYFLKSQKSCIAALGRGVAQNNINLSILRNFEVPIPDLPMQKQIVAILDKTAKVVEVRQQQLQQLDELVKARFIPCTYLAQTAVRTLFKARLETGAGIHAPLIVEGKSGRLTPERYKKFVDKVLESVIPEYSKTSRTDLIRASFEGYCRNICGMDIGQVQKILGLQAQQTYEQWYVDYGSRLALLRIEAQLERCHKLLVSDGENLTDRVYLRWRKKRGEQMIIKDKYGVKIDIL